MGWVGAAGQPRAGSAAGPTLQRRPRWLRGAPGTGRYGDMGAFLKAKLVFWPRVAPIPGLMAATHVQMATVEQTPGSSLQNSFTLTLLSNVRISSFPNHSL